MLPNEEMLRMDEVAKKLKVNRQTVYRAIKAEPGMPCMKIGGEFRFYWSEVEDYIRKNPTKKE